MQWSGLYFTCVALCCLHVASGLGHHGLSCQHSAGRWSRHASLNDVIRRALATVSVPAILEPNGIARDDGKRPDGMTLIPWQNGRSLVWDATCVDTLAASHVRSTAVTAGAAAAAAECNKRRKYAALGEGYMFVPFGVETFGPWGPDARQLSKDIASRLVDVSGDPRAGVYFRQRISLTIQREPLRYHEDNRENGVRRRRSDERDGLALSREIFRNITQQLRENIKREGATDRADRLLPNKLEDNRQYGPGSFQAYHHHEHHWGPYFEGEVGEGSDASQVTAHVGSEALLNCRVGMLKDKTVMWLRRTPESAQLLTVGPAPYAGDNRIAVKFQYPNNWRLSINPVRKSDAGLYMCQISTHPPRAILANLTVLPPILTINGDETHEVKDRFYKAGSLINLACIISEDYLSSLPTKPPTTTQLPITTPSSTTTELTTKMSTVFNRIDLVMNKSWSVETTTITSTVSISTTTQEPKTTPSVTTVAATASPIINNLYGLVWKKQGHEVVDRVTWRNLSATISVSSASQNDSGTYSCHLQNHSQAIVNVHVLMAGENQAAVHHDTWNKGNLFWKSQNFILTSISPLLLVFTH